jgi:hypothetical protein
LKRVEAFASLIQGVAEFAELFFASLGAADTPKQLGANARESYTKQRWQLNDVSVRVGDE